MIVLQILVTDVILYLSYGLCVSICLSVGLFLSLFLHDFKHLSIWL